METREEEGSASALEVPVPAPGSGYNFRPRSRSATAPKDRRLGSVEAKGAGSTLDLPAAPPNSPSPHGGNHDFCTNHPIENTTLIHDAITTITAVHNKLRNNSTLIPNTVTAGVSSYNSTIPCPRKKGATDFFAITFTNIDGFS